MYFFLSFRSPSHFILVMRGGCRPSFFWGEQPPPLHLKSRFIHDFSFKEGWTLSFLLSQNTFSIHKKIFLSISYLLACVHKRENRWEKRYHLKITWSILDVWIFFVELFFRFSILCYSTPRHFWLDKLSQECEKFGH